MLTAAETVSTCGSALVMCEDGDPVEGLPHLRYAPARPFPQGQRLITVWDEETKAFVSTYQPVRPMPTPDGWFETVWEAYRVRMRGIIEA